MSRSYVLYKTFIFLIKIKDLFLKFLNMKINFLHGEILWRRSILNFIL